MELEVRVVGGIESCFVSLPLLLIQALEQTRSSSGSGSGSGSGSLPSFLALELRSRNAKDLWHVAWSGSASSSSAIEESGDVAMNSLKSSVTKSALTGEPHTEDDWEVLELNSEYAEAAILKQVGIVHEAMRFPLWLHGRTIITFLVVSTFPKSPVVQLVTGTEVAVAPKRRKRIGDSCEDSYMQSSNKEHSIGKGTTPQTAQKHSLDSHSVVIVPRLPFKESFKNLGADTLNIKNGVAGKQVNGGIVTDKQDCRQAVVRLLISDSVAKGHAMLSKSLLLHLRASIHSFLEKRSDLIPFQFLACSEKWRVVSFPVLSTIAYQLVIMLDSGGLSRVSMLFQFENMGLNEEGFVGYGERVVGRRKGVTWMLDIFYPLGLLIVVHGPLIACNADTSIAAKRVTVARDSFTVASAHRRGITDGPLLLIVLNRWIYVKRCKVNLKKDTPLLSLSPCQLKDQRYTPKTNSDANMGIIDWSSHERVIAALSNGLPKNEDKEAVTKANIKKGLYTLLHAWYSAQLHAISSNAGVEVNSLVLGNKSLLHFVMKDYGTGKHGKVNTSSNFSFGIKHKIGEQWTDILYVLSASEESPHSAEVYTHELAFDDGNMGNNNLKNSESLIEKLNLGDPVNLYSVKESTSDKLFKSKISSLGWMGTAASDVINRLIVLLSSASGMLLSRYNLPFPGHVLICGPPGSGKTLLAKAVAQSVEEYEDIFAHIVFVCCSKLALEKSSTIRQALSGFVSEALDHAPSVVIFDDLDSIISSSTDFEGSQPSSSVVELTQFLTDIMDEYGHMVPPHTVIMHYRGRFDFQVQLPAPAASERCALLNHEIQKRSLQCLMTSC
ncbi:peroxisome 1 [Actinidia rufa]|uniref:Peroxisomal ATPase PEX1 n=1 Tax=Actinidia rufa TaxID=165716 RepID=A0A7J0GD46_9ERIC|nr:peroxisome 1 [Actinidia rufa]